MGKESTTTATAERPGSDPKKMPSFSLKRMIGRKLDRSSSSPNVNQALEKEKAKEKANQQLAASSEHTQKRTFRMPSKPSNAEDEMAAAKDFERMLQRHAVQDIQGAPIQKSSPAPDSLKGSSHHSKKGGRFKKLMGGGRTSAKSATTASTSASTACKSDEDMAAAKNFESMFRHSAAGNNLLDCEDSDSFAEGSLSSHADPFLTGDPAVAKLLRHASSGVATGGAPVAAQPRLDRAVSAPGAVAVRGIGGGASACSSLDEEDYQEYSNDNQDETKKDDPNHNKSSPQPDEEFVPVMEATLVEEDDAEEVQAMKDLMQEKNSQLQEMEKQLEAMRKALAGSAIVAEPVKAEPVKSEPVKRVEAAQETKSTASKEAGSSYQYDKKLTNEENFAMEMLLGGSSHGPSKKTKPKRSRSKSPKRKGSKFSLF